MASELLQPTYDPASARIRPPIRRAEAHWGTQASWGTDDLNGQPPKSIGNWSPDRASWRDA